MSERIQVQLKLRPTKAQARTMERWLWHLTGVWNWAISAAERERLSSYALKGRLRGHSVRMGIPSDVLTGTAYEAWLAVQRHSRHLSGRARRKSVRRRLSSIPFDHWGIKARGTRISVPGLGPMRFHQQDIPDGRVGQARIVRRASGWHLCLFVQTVPRQIPAIADRAVGIDPGFTGLLTLSTGEVVDHPNELRQGADRLAQAQRGRNRRLAARLHERIANRRKNRNHHLSRRLVAENRLIAFSADNHRVIARAFGKSVTSAGHYQLRSMLAYKSRAGGRQYIEVSSRNSTRTCSACGALSGPTGWRGLSVRMWDCGACGAHHDRDVNAAVNTLKSGLGTSHKGRREAASGIAR